MLFGCCPHAYRTLLLHMTQPATHPTDPELSSLPEPRRPWRKVTIGAMALTLLGALLLAGSLRPQLGYALRSQAEQDLGELENATLDDELSNSWVHGTGVLSDRAVAYQRPLIPGEYRLVPLVNNDRLWIEVQVPSDLDAERFIPPTSFVGRLVRLSEAGLGYETLGGLAGGPGPDAWVLLDGQTPAGTRWVFGVLLLLLGFVGFSGFGLYRVLKRATADG
jgi:hypothetical protein